MTRQMCWCCRCANMKTSKKQGIDDELIMSICEAEDYERDGKIVVNNIGITTYLSFDDLTADELMAIAELKKEIEE